MSLTKRWLEKVSEDMGLNGDIDQKVMDESSARAQAMIDSQEDELRELYEQDLLNSEDL